MPNALPREIASLDLRLLERLIDSVETVIRGKHETVRLSVATLLAGGHLLLEDVPGVGKTTLARGLAASLGLGFHRIQFTSDLLPSDVLGVPVYNPHTRDFETRPGPIFTHVVLADEINRAPPRTQSGLLEAMQEGRVTIDQTTHPLPRPFLVIATQNPLEQHGTYPLPESQLDRFMMRLSIGYPDEAAERGLLLGGGGAGTAEALESMAPVLDREQLLALQQRVETVRVEPELVDYVLAITTATRRDGRFRTGVSTRGVLVFFRAARAYALVDGRTFLVPDDVKRLVGPCLAHRLAPAGGGAAASAHDTAAAILEEIVDGIPVPL
jgi:MoxR-like ATPase